jgi:alanine racemase
MKYSIKEIASVLHFDENQLGNKEAIVSHLLTDSRSLTYPEETLFFAIRTKNNDGHHYIEQLYNKGVRNFVVETLDGIPANFDDANFLLVGSTLDALQSLATYHRRRFDIPVIGITGSRGKTTLKEWLYQLLRDDYRIVRSPRSFNSQIGVPLSLWDIDDNTTLAIIEAGISTSGEMEKLQSMIRPTIGIITNIGHEHDDGFLSMQEKANEKAKLLTNCECIVYCADDEHVASTVQPILAVAQELAWSRRNGDAALFVSKIEKLDKSTTIEYRYIDFPSSVEIPFTVDGDIENAINCIAVMLYLHVSPQVIAERASRLTRVGTRINVVEGVNNCTIIADSYTSDFYSLTPAIDFMARRTSANQANTAILSDFMPETFSDDELYNRIGELMKNKNITRVIGIGEDMCTYSKYFGVNSQFFHTTAEFLANMSQSDFENETILVKGAPEYDFNQIIDMLEAKQHQTVEEVNLNALAHNFSFFRSFIKPETKTVGMVKASGYGAGAYELARTLQDRGADYLAVAVQDEGVSLRQQGITMPIIILNPCVVNYKSMFAYKLEPEVFSIEECKELIKEAEKYGLTDYPVHIKLDTGMHRLGFLKDQLHELIALLQSQNAIKPASVFSHLCVADEPAQDDYTQMQFAYFDECTKILQAGFNHHIIRHILNTTGIVRFPEHQYDMVRIGIGLYGIATTDDGSEKDLQPVSSLHSVIIAIKEWQAGTTIGYGRHGVITRPSRIATVPIGYADGLDRHFGNGGIKVWINGTLCPIIGNICMDVCMIDVTDANCKVGDNVEIFGEHIPVETLAEVRGTIPYEILTSISPRVKRVYYRE